MLKNFSNSEKTLTGAAEGNSEPSFIFDIEIIYMKKVQRLSKAHSKFNEWKRVE